MVTRSRRTRGQALAEFALIVPIFVLFLGGIVQFGIVFWTQNTLTQVVRDTGRYAAAQTVCVSNAADVVSKANTLASGAQLIGYDASTFSSTVVVTWTDDAGNPVVTTGENRNCPPTDNQTTAWVTVSASDTIPLFFPFIPIDPTLTTSAKFRMEPFAQ